jgi:hypothetical protein
MSGIWFGFEIAVGLVIGVIVTIRVLMFLRLVKYRRGSIQNAPPDLRKRLMLENLATVKKKAASSTPELRRKGFAMLTANLMEPWDEETYSEITKTMAYLAQFDKDQGK